MVQYTLPPHKYGSMAVTPSRQRPSTPIPSPSVAVLAHLRGCASWAMAVDLDDIFAVVNAALAEPGADAPGPGAAAPGAAAPKYGRRSSGLTQRMRDCKKIRRLESGPVVAEHTQRQIDRVNRRFAVRKRDVIDLRARKPPKVKKTGAYRRWLTTASLNCCFGHVIRRGGKNGSRRMTYLAMSGHSVCDVFEGGHTHVQHTMDAGALAVWTVQQERMRSLPFARLCIIKLTFDETETVVSMRGDGQSVRSLFMLHGEVRSFERMDGPGVQHQLMLPPAVLSNTKAECFWPALMSRLPDTLADIKRRCKCMALVIGSDSAKSCIKLGKVFRGRTALTAGMDGCVSVWAPCLMHMAALCVFYVMKVHGVLVPLFCACVLMRQSKVFSAFVVRAELHVDKMDVVFEEPDGAEETRRYLVSLFAFLEQTRSTASDEDAGPRVRSRRQAAARLSKSLSASLVDGGKITELRHYCTYGCCSSEAEAVAKVKADFKLVLFDVAPDVPACNRWTKVYPPLCYWMVLMAFPFTVPALHEVAQVKCDLSEAAVFNDADEVGLGEEDTYHKRFRARFRTPSSKLPSPPFSRPPCPVLHGISPLLPLFSSSSPAPREEGKGGGGGGGG